MSIEIVDLDSLQTRVRGGRYPIPILTQHPPIEDTELAYLAGFFEGDGCITTNKPRAGSCYPRIQIKCVDLDVCHRYKKSFPLGTIYSVKNQRPELTQQHVYRANPRMVVEHILRCIYPYLSNRRQNQVQTVAQMTGMSIDNSYFEFNEDCRLSLSWFAGLFDAEGHIHWTAKGPGMVIVNADRDVIDTAYLVAGVGRINNGTKYAGRKQIFRLNIQSINGVVDTVDKIYPLLSERRKAKCREVIAKIYKTSRIAKSRSWPDNIPLPTGGI